MSDKSVQSASVQAEAETRDAVCEAPELLDLGIASRSTAGTMGPVQEDDNTYRA